MAGEKKIQESPVAQGLKTDSSTKLPEKDMAPKKDGIPSDLVSSARNATAGVKGEIDHVQVAEQGVYYPPTSCYNYYYPGYNDQAYLNAGAGPYNGMQSDNGSLLYYIPGYNPYAAGYMGVDGKQPYVSSGYLQQPVSYGSEPLQCYSWDPTYTADVFYGTGAKAGNMKPAMNQNGSLKSNGFNTSKTNGNLSSKSSSTPLNSKAKQFEASSTLSKAVLQNQPLKPLNKLGSSYHQPMGLMKGFYPVGKFPSYSNQNYGGFMHYAPVNYQTNGRVWNGNQKYKPRGNFNRNGEFEASTELTRGPRANRSAPPKSSAEGEEPMSTVQTEKYNSEDFPSEYDNAKFYVIKSYSEDDIHKCIKYDVWSSTPNGNKRLEAAFQDAETKTSETGKKCPVFLFFSVNGSGQFLGVAEMIGQVDFNKKMDFWQLDKWNGFFPVKWHIVKDVPNGLLRHIILKNNLHRAVTYSRDTQEIGLNQGLEMLSIFKSYAAKTCLLDDFTFYEQREKSLKANRSSTTGSLADDATKPSEKTVEESVKADTSDPATIIDLTKNLSLNSQPLTGSV